MKRKKVSPLRVSSGFREFVLGQLADVPDLYAKPMFGGIGLYSGEVFFGIVAGDVLYFKVDDTNRADYEQAGSRPFKPYADRPVTMRYYSVPVVVVEDAAVLAQWAKRSIRAARAADEGMNGRAGNGRASGGTGPRRASEGIEEGGHMSGHKQQKKDGGRKDKQTRARKQDFEQPVARAAAPQRAQDTSNFTDGDTAGPDWKAKARERA